jgi:energy-coupling factor transport system permease protein
MRSLTKFQTSTIHPGSWWILGFSLAVAAGMTNQIWVALLISLVAVSLAGLLRTEAPWARSLGFYMSIAAVIVVIRIAFRIVFNTSSIENIAFTLPELNLSLGFGPPIQLLGAVSWNTLQAATMDGLRLAAIVLSIALANTLANPRKLLKSTPAALYEVATAISVAINLAPQLIESLQRVRRARRLRGKSPKIGALAGTVIPVLEDTLERSLSLAASMDARGFGRRGNLSNGASAAIRVMSLAALVLFSVGSYLLLTNANATTLALSLLLLAVVAVVYVVSISSSKNVRTRYKKQKQTLADFSLWIVSALVVAASVWAAGGLR